MKIAFSWDDGALEDQKLFELHEKYKIPGMFFVPTRNCEGRDVITPDMIRKSESEYVRFGGHTENHTYLTNIPITKVEDEVVRNKEYLENVLCHKIEDFCLPGGQYNKQIIDIIYRHYKTIRTADTMNFKYKSGPLKPAIHFFPRGKKSLVGNALRNKSIDELVFLLTHLNKSYFELISGLIEKDSKENKVIMIWGHSWELEEYNLWEQLENLFIFINNTFKKSICTYREIFEEDKSEK